MERKRYKTNISEQEKGRQKNITKNNTKQKSSKLPPTQTDANKDSQPAKPLNSKPTDKLRTVNSKQNHQPASVFKPEAYKLKASKPCILSQQTKHNPSSA